MRINKALLKVIKEVGSRSDFADIIGYSESHVRCMLCGARKVPPKIVNLLVELSNGKVSANELRPDIFRSSS